MLLLRIVVLGGLICIHVVGGAVLFRRLFPRESPWWGFFVPMLALVSLLNFVEHAVALPVLAGLLPFSTLGLILVMIFSRDSWKGLRVPSLLFVGIFSFCLAIKSAQPFINFYNTEGLTNLNRILDFCLGDKVPPRDCWLPPYPHSGYYTFMHYGASVLKRFLDVDIGTAFNLSSALLSAFTLMACGAAAFSLSRYRIWIAGLTMLVMAGGFTGSTPIRALMDPGHPDPTASLQLGAGFGDGTFGLLTRLATWNPPDDTYRIYTPGCYIYYSEFHATMAGHFLALLTVFAVAEVLRRRRANFPWIYLVIAPVMTVISCTWFVFMVVLMALPALIIAWMTGRRPAQWKGVVLGIGIGLGLLAPALINLLYNAVHEPFRWSENVAGDLSNIIIQWWPVYLPWLALCFAWKRMSLAARWLHLVLLPIFICTEAFYFSDRSTTLEKTWSGTFGIGLAILFPLMLIQKGWAFRGLSVVLVLTGLLSLGAWLTSDYNESDWYHAMRLPGDSVLQINPQQTQMERILAQVRGQTVLPGIAPRAWFESPCVPAFTENRCYIGWANAEETCGHPDEAHQRQKEAEAFYQGTMPEPLNFLRTAGISAVQVWPDDHISDEWLAKAKQQLAPDFTYFDCKENGKDNAGVFMKKSLVGL